MLDQPAAQLPVAQRTNPERSFAEEVRVPRLGDGETTSDIAATLEAMGVKWLRTIRTYYIATMLTTLRQAMATDDKGPKVIVADGECQLARQRRIRPQVAQKLKRGERVVRTRFGVDDEVCTGDHPCIQVIEPALARRMTPRAAADAVASARVAALADPTGDTLSKTLAAIAAVSPALRHAAA